MKEAVVLIAGILTNGLESLAYDAGPNSADENDQNENALDGKVAAPAVIEVLKCTVIISVHQLANLLLELFSSEELVIWLPAVDERDVRVGEDVDDAEEADDYLQKSAAALLLLVLLFSDMFIVA